MGEIYYELFGRVTICIFRNSEEAVIIDSGIDENQIRKVINHLKEDRVIIKGLYLTHSHADHSGGAFFAKERGIRVFAPEGEAALLESPDLLNIVISGFNNRKISGSKFVTPASFQIEKIVEPITLGKGMVNVIGLNGHTMHHTGYECNNTLFAGDSLFTIETLEKHAIPYVIDVPMFLESLNTLENYQGTVIVSHSGVVEEKYKTIEYNRKRIQEIIELVRDLSIRGIGLASLTDKVLANYQKERDILSYFLDSTTIKSIVFSYMDVTVREGELFVTST
jgi:glyoxylase-like metal-dependent hydrolase (beta-lactamase superfamily II)